MPEGHKLDCDKIDDCVLALLALGLHDHNRVWKGFDWGAMRRLYAKGLIGNPVGRNKSVMLTDEGLQRSQVLLRAHFQEKPSKE